MLKKIVATFSPHTNSKRKLNSDPLPDTPLVGPKRVKLGSSSVQLSTLADYINGFVRKNRIINRFLKNEAPQTTIRSDRRSGRHSGRHVPTAPSSNVVPFPQALEGMPPHPATAAAPSYAALTSAAKHNLAQKAVTAMENYTSIQPWDVPEILTCEYLDLLLIYAAKNNLFSSVNTFKNAFQLLGFLQQFTNIQDFCWTSPDLDTSHLGLSYIHRIMDRQLMIDVAVDSLHEFGLSASDEKIEAVTTAIKAIPDNEYYFLAIPLDQDISKPSIGANLMAQAITKCPFFFQNKQEDGSQQLLIPSMSLFKQLLKLAPYPQNFEGVPILGRVGTVTRDRMHKAGHHPLPVSSKHVKSNYLTVHHMNCGPALTWAHDMYHLWMGCLVSKQHSDAALNDIIPWFRHMASDLEMREPFGPLRQFFLQLADEVGDFNFEDDNHDPSQPYRYLNFTDNLAEYFDYFDTLWIAETKQSSIKPILAQYFSGASAYYKHKYGFVPHVNKV